jgi:hypothetical protein
MKCIVPTGGGGGGGARVVGDMPKKELFLKKKSYVYNRI